MIRRAVFALALLVAATVGASAQQVANRTITITFTVNEWAAATQRVGMCASVPTGDGLTVTVDCIPTITAWAHKQLRDNLTPELTALKLDRAAAIDADDASVKALDAKACAVVNAALKAQALPPLKRCGGGSVP